jgi:RNA polymerase sigma-70 factor (ECF subfamily)
VDHADLDGALLAARNGDAAGFDVLWCTLQPALLRYLRVIVGSSAEDAAAQTWLQVARDLYRFKGHDAVAFKVWLFRIARNRGIDAQRHARRHRGQPRDPNLAGTVGAPDSSSKASERLDTDRALALIAALPTGQAEAVLLRVVAGLDVFATAAVLGVRPGAVRAATLHGLRRLADIVEVDPRPYRRRARPAVPAEGV